jgi:hypothetical protein
MTKKNFILILLVLTPVVSCNRELLLKKNIIPLSEHTLIKYLTEDSVKYWELEFDNNYQGIYFTREGSCGDYYIDDNNKRISENHSDLIEKIPLSYRITRDSLKICFKNCSMEPCCFFRYKILKLTRDSLIVRTKNVFYGIDTVYEKIVISHYHSSKDQRTKPQFIIEAYPNDKSRWPKMFGK